MATAHSTQHNQHTQQQSTRQNVMNHFCAASARNGKSCCRCMSSLSDDSHNCYVAMQVPRAYNHAYLLVRFKSLYVRLNAIIISAIAVCLANARTECRTSLGRQSSEPVRSAHCLGFGVRTFVSANNWPSMRKTSRPTTRSCALRLL